MDTHFSSKSEKDKWERVPSPSGYSGAGGRKRERKGNRNILILKKTTKESGYEVNRTSVLNRSGKAERKCILENVFNTI